MQTDKLERKLGLFPTTNIVIGNMIGVGIFTTSGFLITKLNNPLLMLILWLVGGMIALCGALIYGELGAAMPKAGGEFVFLTRLFHPRVGFLSGWVSFFVGFSAPMAASAIGFTEYLTRAFPILLEPGILPEPVEAVVLKKVYSILVIILFMVIHIRGLKFGALVQNYVTLLKVGLILGIILFGFWLGKGNFSHFSLGGNFKLDFGSLKAMGLSLMWIMFAYSGWNASAYIGSEIKNPRKILPRSLLMGTGIVILVYLLLNLFYIYALTPAEMKDVISITGLAAESSFSTGIENILSALVAVAMFSSLSAYLILGPRVYYSMALKGYFFKFAAEVSPRTKIPVKSILLQGAIAMVLVMVGTFDQIITYMGFSLGIFPILAAVGIFKLRRQKWGSFKSPGYPFVQVAFILPSIAILILAYFDKPVESSIAVGTVLIGLPVYRIFKKTRQDQADPAVK